MCTSSMAILCLGTVYLAETERLYCGDIRMRQEATESHRKIVIIYLSVDEEVAYPCSISFPATTVPACQGVIVELADTVDRHYHPKALPGLPQDGGFWAALASCCSYRSLGAATQQTSPLPVWEICCAVFRAWSSPYPWWCQQLARPTTARSYAS